eukprot:TRINITY_DN108816_c0_g1_i1.p1 TRINITY_DN108816_c0_g1~~TRINITY_DN108816_c0_g1_i1.p1  ORF type:complete len:129 (-),score=5.97 TRINITY_DN108816_c0_g1_i1:28-414(-)
MQSHRCVLLLLSAIFSHAEMEGLVPDILSAVLSKDECAGTARASCALNALQLHSSEKDMADKAIDREGSVAACKPCNSICQDLVPMTVLRNARSRVHVACSTWVTMGVSLPQRFSAVVLTHLATHILI